MCMTLNGQGSGGIQSFYNDLPHLQRQKLELGFNYCSKRYSPSCYSQQKQNTNQITHSNLCRKCQISAFLHIALAHLNAFRINYFRSLRGSLIWLTNTPTVVTSHINSKCLMVTNSYHELLSMVLNKATCAQIPGGICIGQGNLSSIITATETFPSGYTPVTPKEFMKRSPHVHGADLS